MTANDRPAGGDGRDFNLFFAEKLRPVIAEAAARRRSAMKRALMAAAAAFIVFLGVAYYFLRPHMELLDEHRISHWPLLVLMPATMAVIFFSLVYILALRTLVGDFKNGLIRRMAEYIDAGCVHETGRETPAADLAASLLFDESETPRSGREHFRGGMGATGYEFTDVTLNAGGKQPLTGIFFSAGFERGFRSFTLHLPPDVPASLRGIGAKLSGTGIPPDGDLVRYEDSATGRQAVTNATDPDAAWATLPAAFRLRAMALQSGRKAGMRVSCLGNRLAVCILAGNGTDKQGVLDGFDFGHYREFCDDARLCLSLARALGESAAVWRNDENA